MATCIQCQGTKKKRVLISEQYCDVCGFGFLMEPENAGRTCRDPNRIIKGSPPILKDKEEDKPVEEEEACEVCQVPTTTSVMVVNPATVSTTLERVFEAIKSHPMIGKQEIMTLARVSDDEYTEAKNALLESKRITQDGQKRGAKYKVL